MRETINTTNEAPEIPVERELSLAKKLEISEAKNKELQEKLEYIKKLFGIIAHDLKGPVNTTTVFTELLSEYIKDGSITMEELADNLDMIYRNSDATSKLLEDLLTWSRLQLDEIKPEILAMNLAKEIEISVAPLLLAMKQKEIKFENKIPNDLDILADSNMLQTVVRNLSSNAIKFTNQGGNISISCEKKDNLVEIHITDDGVGLSEDKVKNLFESTGISTLGTNEEKGTGFGLSICKEMVEKMGGNIKVISEGKSKGTTFIVTLPAGE